jgi:hypothetical protein
MYQFGWFGLFAYLACAGIIAYPPAGIKGSRPITTRSGTECC